MEFSRVEARARAIWSLHHHHHDQPTQGSILGTLGSLAQAS